MVSEGLPISGLIERAGADRHEMGAGFGLGEDVRPAFRAEAPVHDVAAIRLAGESLSVPSMLNASLGKATLTVALPAPMNWHTRHQQVRAAMGSASMR
jgi:hypothetical protein